MHAGSRPDPAEIAGYTHAIQTHCDRPFIQTVVREPPVDLLHDVEFLLGSRLQDDPVGLQALMLPMSQFSLHSARLVQQDPTQAKACVTALAKPHFHEAALACKDFGR